MTTIGIPGYEDDGMFGVASNYMSFAAEFGTPVIITPSGKFPSVDAFLLPGGADVAPSRYGFPGFHTGRSNPHLEYFDTAILPDILGSIPVFGICRGLQTVNVVCGGTLAQHIWGHPYSASEDHEVHAVVDHPRGKKLFKVNSFHHQAINILGNDLKVELWSDDGHVEAISGQKMFAVQWHPERLHDEYSMKKFQELLK